MSARKQSGRWIVLRGGPFDGRNTFCPHYGNGFSISLPSDWTGEGWDDETITVPIVEYAHDPNRRQYTRSGPVGEPIFDFVDDGRPMPTAQQVRDYEPTFPSAFHSAKEAAR